MKIIECEQGSPEWHKIRCGIPTASEFDKIITSKGELSKQRENYLFQLAGERIIKCPTETYQNEIMVRGKEFEEEARKYYELATKSKVHKVGFCLDEKLGVGCSPDGLIRKDGGLEIKCPILSTHTKYLYNWFNNIPSEYFQQIQGNLLVTGRKWWDFLSYYPGMKPLLIRVRREEKFIQTLEIELNKFCKELKKIVNKIK